MSHPSHSKLVEVWNPDQKSFYTACLLDIDEGLSTLHLAPIFPIGARLTVSFQAPAWALSNSSAALTRKRHPSLL
jgi:hypothetical protein